MSERNALNDALADAAEETLALYKSHMIAGRYADAAQCLSAVDDLVGQTTALEERAEDFEASRYVHVNVGNVAAAAPYPDQFS